MQKKYICLQEDQIIGTGRDRVVYQHPEIRNQCIKISKSSDKYQKQTRRECCYFSYLMRHHRNTGHIAQYLSYVETNLGPGASFELIIDDDKNISLTLTEFIKKNPKVDLSEKIQELLDYLYTEAICVRDLSPNNVVVQNTMNNLRLVIIDGVSNPGVNPLNIRIKFLSRFWAKKTIKSFERKLQILINKK